MAILSHTEYVRVQRLKYSNAPGYQYTYYWKYRNREEDRYSAREIASEFSFKRVTLLENAIERHWLAHEAATGVSIWELDITDWIKREALAARLKAQQPTRQYVRLTPGEKIQRTKEGKAAYRRKHIIAMRAAGTAPDPFKSDPAPSADPQNKG